MEKQNKAAIQIINALDALGYKVELVELKTYGTNDYAYIEGNIKISRLGGYPPEPQAGDRTE